METSVDPFANERDTARAAVAMAEKVFHRSLDGYKYMMTGMAALSFLIVDVSKNLIATHDGIPQSEALLIFLSISSCVICIGYIYRNYYYSGMAIFGQYVATFNLERADRDNLTELLDGISKLVIEEYKSSTQRRCHIACSTSICLSLVTFGVLLLNGR
jgi:hypothetical protein